MKTVYAIPNYECNLDCPHCIVHKKHIDYDRDAFISQLKSLENDYRVVLFGGEPTLYNDRFIDICSNIKVSSVSTNLVDISDDILSVLTQPDISIATSWNKTRFSDIQMQSWLNNLKRLSEIGKKCLVLITMTPDLVYDEDQNNLYKTLESIDKTNGVSGVLFEHLLSDSTTDEFFQRCDDWLCRIHDNWRFSFENKIEKKVLDWKFDCSQTYTLNPDGKLTKGCPQAEKSVINLKCISCSFAAKCHPCMLQKNCTFPIKLLEKLMNSKIYHI